MRKVFQWCGVLMLVLAAQAVHAQSNLMVTTVVTFNGTNGSYPHGELTQGNDGFFYGATTSGGAFGLGTIFRTTLDGDLTTLVAFDGTNGANPYVSPVLGSDGSVYGANSSNVFQLTSNGVFNTLLSFNGTNGSNPSSLMMGADGCLYGTTISGGTFTNVLQFGLVGYGTVFKLTTNGAFTLLSSFNGTNGERPGFLMQATDGDFYGITAKGGAYGLGTVFRMMPDGTVTTLASFNGTNGNSPFSLMQASDGCLYGTTDQGGTNFGGNIFGTIGFGSVFKITTNGEFTSLSSFNGSDGAFPRGRLLEVSNGVFYGTTYMGGQGDYGTMFQITTNGVTTKLLSFYAAPIALPVSGLVKGGDGNLYGLSQYYGNTGVLFCFRPIEPPISTLEIQGDQVVLKWKAFGGVSYTFGVKDQLTDPIWQYHGGTNSIRNTTARFSESITPGGQKFYQVFMYVPNYQ